MATAAVIERRKVAQRNGRIRVLVDLGEGDGLTGQRQVDTGLAVEGLLVAVVVVVVLGVGALEAEGEPATGDFDLAVPVSSESPSHRLR